MSFEIISRENDVFSCYMDVVETLSNKERRMRRSDENYVIELRHRKEYMLPTLSRIALRILVTPASSSSSERDFSKLKSIINPESSA